MKRRDFLKHSGLLLASAPFMSFGLNNTNINKMMVLGFDGMDPHIVHDMVKRGHLPNFRKLMDTGQFSGMVSTAPPESPCAWSSFSTGEDPGTHGIFGFLNKTPGGYMPATALTTTKESKKFIKLGGYKIPIDSSKISLNRDAVPFWEHLMDRDIHSTIVKMPANYPPTEMKYGSAISGMGTPDLHGDLGKFTLFTSDEDEANNGNASKGFYKLIYLDSYNTFQDEIEGPLNTLKKEPEPVNIPFISYIDKKHKTIRIDIQGQKILLKKGEISKWISLKFQMIPNLSSITGIVRFYLLDIDDEKLRIYMTPISIDPENPAQAISQPSNYSNELFNKVGKFHTLGLPLDFNAIKEDVFNLENYIAQSETIFNESKKLYNFEFARFLERKKGFLFHYFSSIDQGSHIYYSLRDKNHPRYSQKETDLYGDQIEILYSKFDKIIGETINKLPKDIPLIIVSDHGFAPLYRKVDINNILHQNGFLNMNKNEYEAGTEMYLLSQKSEVKAFATGLNGIYLNIKDREPEGSIEPQDKRRVLEEIKNTLLNQKDPQNGKSPISNVYFSEDIYSKKNLHLGPDILVGYNRGYGLNTAAALGGITKEAYITNNNRWTGDHIIDPYQVPAMLLTSFKYKKKKQINIWDIAPTILNMFGINNIQNKGKSLI